MAETQQAAEQNPPKREPDKPCGKGREVLMNDTCFFAVVDVFVFGVFFFLFLVFFY
jgi:hypothetical protein